MSGGSTVQLGPTVPPLDPEPTIPAATVPAGRLLFTGIAVFLANAALLVLQLVAGRLLAPYVGSSLATWTAVIGVFLAGIAAGNYVGGKLADRWATGWTLRFLLLAGGLALLSSVGVTHLLGDGSGLRRLPLTPRIALVSILVCFPSAFILSLATPVTIKLLLPDVRSLGRVVGAVYAIGTLGCLVGNFVTGFYLAATFGTVTIITVTAVSLFMLAALVPRGLVAVDAAAAEPAPSVDADERLNPTLACAVVFFCSFASMAVELAASRLFAPSLGVSLYTWTGIIGVVLAAVALGNTLGGRLADRAPTRLNLGSALFWAGFFTLVILPAFILVTAVRQRSNLNLLGNEPVGPIWSLPAAGTWFESLIKYPTWVIYQIDSWPLPGRIVGLAVVHFFAAMVMFGRVSPLVTRLAASDWQSAGRVAGRIYAWSCTGAIAGTFATGWYLIGAFGVMKLIVGLSVGLLLLSIPIGRLWRKPVEMLGAGIVLGGVAIAVVGQWLPTSAKQWCVAKLGPNLGELVTDGGQFLRFDRHAFYERETDYYLVRVKESSDEEEGMRQLCLDLLIHSHVKGDWMGPDDNRVWVPDVSVMGYGHEQMQAEFARATSAVHANPRMLVIGGGGYTFPRWVDKFLPQFTVDVVEIDPGVTEAVHLALGMPRDTKIRSYNLDGRQYVQELAEPGSYHLVIQDAVNDLSVPAHIMTKEYNDLVKRTLTPDGVYLLTVIDDYPYGKLLPAAIATMRATFGVENVSLLADGELWETWGRSVYVIAATPKAFSLDEFQAVLTKQGLGKMRTLAMSAEALDRYLKASRAGVLTDDFAPVDNLIADTFHRRNDGK